MSRKRQAAASPPPAEAAGSPAPPSPRGKAAFLRRRWIRRIAFFFAALAVLLVLLRILLFLFLPAILDHLAKGYGLSCRYERLDLSLLTGDLELWHLVVAPEEGGPAILDAEYLRADLEVSALLGGGIVIRRLEADGLDLEVEREADGTFSLLRRLERAGAKEEEPEGEEEAGDEGPLDEIDLSLPFEIKAFRLQHVRAHLLDRSVEPPLDTLLDLTLRISDLGSRTQKTRLDLTLASPPVLDILRVEGTGSSVKKDLKARLDVFIRGIHPGLLEGYLAPLGIQAEAETLSFGFSAGVETRAAAPGKDALAGRVSLEGLKGDADGEEFVALDRVLLQGDDIGRKHASLSSLELEGGRARARKLASGAVRIAGLVFQDSPGSGGGASGANADAAEPDGDPSPGDPFSWSLDGVALRRFSLGFRDESTNPPADLSLHLEEFSLAPLAGGAPGTEEGGDLEALISIPGVADALTLKGKASLLSQRKSLDLTAAAGGLNPRALRPYLQAAGVESLLEKGEITCRIRASAEPGPGDGLRAELSLNDLRLVDGGELFALERLEVKGIELEPSQSRFRVQAVELEGPRSLVRKEASGDLTLLGFRIKESGKAGSAALDASSDAEPRKKERLPGAGPSDEPVPPLRAPRIEIGRIAWGGARIEIEDESAEPRFRTVLSDAGVEIDDLLVDLDPDGTAPEPARIRAWIALSDLVRELRVEGSLTPNPRAPALDLQVDAEGLTHRAAAAYLKAAGLESSIEEGQLRLHLAAKLNLEDSGLEASLSLLDVLLEDGADELFGVDAVRAGGIRLGEDALRVKALEIDRPRTLALRGGQGALALAGLRFLSVPEKGEIPSPESSGGEGAPSPGLPTDQEAGAHREGARESGPSAFSLELERLRVNKAALLWSDRGLPMPVEASAELDLSADDLTWGGGGTGSAPFQATLHVPGALDRLSLSGRISASPEHSRLLMEIEARGLRAGPLSAYFPAGMAPDLEDGRFRAKLEAGVGPADEGGRQAELTLSDLYYHDVESGPRLLEMDRLRALISRFDPEGGVVDIEEISLTGLAAGMEKTAGQGMRLLGLRFEPVEGGKEIHPLETGRKAAPPSPARQKLISRLREKRSRITVRRFEVNVDCFEVTDRALPAESQTLVTELHIQNREPLLFLGEEPESCPPAVLEIRARAAPVVDSIRITAGLTPFALEPDLDLDLLAEGIRGDRLSGLLPGIEDKIDGSRFTEGRLQGRVELRLRANRRDPLDLDLSRSLGMEVFLKDFQVKNGTEGEVLAGLEELFLDVARADIKSGLLHVRSMEVRKPEGIIRREEEGLYALGLVFRNGPEEEPGTEAEATGSPSDQADGGESGRLEGSPAAGTLSEIRLDKLLVDDIEFTFEDTTADPPMVIPLNGLRVDVRDLSTRAFVEAHPIRFTAALNAGRIDLPVRERRGFLRGVVNSTWSLVPGGSGGKPRELESRPFFDEIALKGVLAFEPVLSGWVEAEVDALELVNLKGPAEKGGVTLDDGVLDAKANLRFEEDGSLDASADFTFTDLKLSEPPNGPIRSRLYLPAPLNTVVFMLRDQSGAIEIPLDFHVPAQGMSATAVAAKATATFGKLVTDALASSPFRIAGTGLEVAETLGGLLPLGGGGKEESEILETVPIFFDPGVAHLTRFEQVDLESIRERLEDDEDLEVVLEHAFGGGDFARARLRANPSQEECLALASRLRQKKHEILMRREEVSARVRASLAADFEREALGSRGRLQALERELGFLEQSLDHVLEISRPGADRRRERRTREAGLAMARTRLVAVREYLCGGEAAELAKRVRVKRPRFHEARGTEGGWITVTLRAK